MFHVSQDPISRYGEKPSFLRVHNFTLQQQEAFWLRKIPN
jgi:hypothetical protein